MSRPSPAQFFPPSLEGARMRWLSIDVSGRRVSGRVRLDAPNPRKRHECAISYTAPASWSADHHAAALRIALHWFRDIGGIITLGKPMLCHIVARLAEDRSEADLHAAVDAYARSEWHRTGKRWTTLPRFFLNSNGALDQWIDKAAESRPLDPSAKAEAARVAEHRLQSAAQADEFRRAERAAASARRREREAAARVAAEDRERRLAAGADQVAAQLAARRRIAQESTP